MIVKEIVCDRCSAKIEGEHPVRINIEEYSTEACVSYGVKCKGYRSTRKIHLCPTCDYIFQDFLNNLKPLTFPAGVK